MRGIYRHNKNAIVDVITTIKYNNKPNFSAVLWAAISKPIEAEMAGDGIAAAAVKSGEDSPDWIVSEVDRVHWSHCKIKQKPKQQ